MIIYPSPRDTKVYLNGKWLKSVYRLEFRTSKDVVPIVNYREAKVQDFATGPSVVSGSIVLNFLHPSYFPLAAEKRVTADNLYEKVCRLLVNGTPDDLELAATIMGKVGRLEIEAEESIRQSTGALDTPVFDLSVRYADNLWYRLIKGVRLVGEAEVLSASPAPGGDASSSGSPILEQYTFVAEGIEIKQWSKTLPNTTSR